MLLKKIQYKLKFNVTRFEYAYLFDKSLKTYNFFK